MTYATNFLAGAWPFERDATFAEGVPGGSVPGIALGQRVQAYDSFWGSGEFIFLKFATVSTLVEFGSVVIWDNNFLLAKSAAADSHVQGRPFGILATRFPSNTGVGSTTPFYGWVMLAGMIPATFSVAATAGAVYQGTAGNLTPTANTGAGVLGLHTMLAATAAITKTVTTQNGSNRLQVPSKDGLYPGVAVSGTGLSGTVLSLDSGKNNEVILSANASATGTVTATFTDTGFGRVMLEQPHFQGQIT